VTLGATRRGRISFTIESRILRELGERLVRQPEVALLELIKNAYDADADRCTIEEGKDSISVSDTGTGMTLETFTSAWMRIGTSSKERDERSARYQRELTGEKGIGRFAVRFLGRKLKLTSVAEDARGRRTRLVATFDWAEFDRESDLGSVEVPYTVTNVRPDTPTGTRLDITKLRDEARRLDWKKIRTGSVGVISPVRSLLKADLRGAGDPGFVLVSSSEDEEREDLSTAMLDYHVLRASIVTKTNRVQIRIFRYGERRSRLEVNDSYPHELGAIRADIRFFPKRPGTFIGAPIDGRRAYSWVRDHSGVKVFDRGFQVQPYGEAGDDWLTLVEDAARNQRHPRSEITKKHFPMSGEVANSTKLNWMLRLPQSLQLIGVVEVKGRRSRTGAQKGLVPAADREGFVANAAFAQLEDIVRGAVEMIAVADRQLQQEEGADKIRREIEEGQESTRRAIEEIEADEHIPPAQKERIVAMLAESQERLERQEEGTKEREQQLEVMSLLGVVGGFMTHEFGTAIAELRDAQEALEDLAGENPRFATRAKRFARHVEKLEAFVAYSELYVRGARGMPESRYPVRPRLNQVTKLFADYARDRRIKVEIGVEPGVLAPLVPVSLYNGIAQNLLTNALKAVTASTDERRRLIAMRAWNDGDRHHLQVSDTGIGIPQPARRLVFDPLFTTTENGKDPLGSGMGLGLALVKRGAAAFGGTAKLTDPPPGFSTCVEVQFPIEQEDA
jgi:signal transduction histidine kinase